MTIDKVSWGFRRNAHLSDYLTDLELITTLTQTISCGGIKNLRESFLNYLKCF